jgi:23S rRNA pseudouridine1911/1915/1917 synthase
MVNQSPVGRPHRSQVGWAVRESVPSGLAGERLDRVVSMMTGLSRSAATALVADGLVQVNGAVVTTRSHRLGQDDVVDVEVVDEVAGPVVVADPTVVVEVVYEDDDVVVVNKPPGLVVHPGAGNPTGTLVHGLLHRYPEMEGVGEPWRPGLVHRLDADTSGLLVVARTPEAYDGLVAQLAGHHVDRQYDALVWGLFETPAGRVDAPIGRSRRHPTRMAVSAAGRDAVTDYTVEETFHQPVVVSRLRCRLHTGRTHQIRVHLAGIGHPVVGDSLYGGVRESLAVPRLCLHAARLGFVHPVTGEDVVVTAPPPDDLARVFDGLRQGLVPDS